MHPGIRISCGLMEVGAGLLYAYAPLPYQDVSIGPMTLEGPVISVLATLGGLAAVAYGAKEITDGLIEANR